MIKKKCVMTARAFLIALLLIFCSSIVIYPTSSSVNASNIDSTHNALALSSNSDQIVMNGDYVVYSVNVNGDVGTQRFDFLNVDDLEMTVQVTSTIWYFGSFTHTYSYYYNENGEIIIADLYGSFIDPNKIGEAKIQTAYGLKNIMIYSYWEPGPYSNALRTHYVPFGCQVSYKYYGNDTDGNHVVRTLASTNIEWLKNVGQAQEYKVPSIPGSPSAIEGNAHIDLSWTAPDDNGHAITKYNVYRSSTETGPYSIIASPLDLSYIDIGLTNGHTYWYRISAVNSVGEGEKTDPLSANPYTTPNAPTGLSSISGDAQVTLYWNAPFSGGRPIDYYVVYQDGITLKEHPTGLMTVITSLNNGQKYNFTLAAHNLRGIGAKSEIESATPISEPDAPVDLVAITSNAQVSLIWSAPNDTGGSLILNYKVYRGSTSEGETLLVTLMDVLTYTDTGLNNGEEYWYKVSAVNAIGESAYSNAVNATPFTVPDSPIPTSAIGGLNSTTLTWAEPLFDGGSVITGYKVFHGPIEPTTQFGETLPSTSVTVSVTGLVPGALYYFAIVAVNAAGESPMSSILSARVLDKPGPVTSLIATATSGQVSLTWTPPIGTGGSPVVSYLIYRGTSVGVLNPFDSCISTSFINTQVEPGTTYYYVVTAENIVGESDICNTVSVTVPLPTLSGRIVDADGNGMSGITVALENGSSVETNAEGNFSIAASPGDHILTISGPGIVTTTKSVSVANSGETLSSITATSASNGGDITMIIAIVAVVTIVGIIATLLYMRRK